LSSCSSTARTHICDLHSFPTRRSSDLRGLRGSPTAGARRAPACTRPCHARPRGRHRRGTCCWSSTACGRGRRCPPRPAAGALARSEEHTSELQSRVDLVCRLLLEKKKK